MHNLTEKNPRACLDPKICRCRLLDGLFSVTFHSDWYLIPDVVCTILFRPCDAGSSCSLTASTKISQFCLFQPKVCQSFAHSTKAGLIWCYWCRYTCVVMLQCGCASWPSAACTGGHLRQWFNTRNIHAAVIYCSQVCTNFTTPTL